MNKRKATDESETDRLERELAAARAELGTARRRYFDLYDLAPVGIFTLDAATGIREANLTLASQLGVKREELSGRLLADFVHEDERARFLEDFGRFLSAGGGPSIESRLRRESGVPFWGRVELALGHEADGSPLCRAVLSDVTERVRAQKDLLRLSVAVDQAHDGLAVADMQGRIEFVNFMWAKEHGYSKEELLGKPLSLFHTAEQLKRDVIPFQKKVLALGSWSGEVGHVRRDGTAFTRWMSTVLLHDADDKVCGFVGMTTDFSERERAEETLSRLLLERQILLKAIPDLFYRLDAEMKLADWNQPFEVVTGYTAEELKGMDALAFFKDDASIAAEGIREAVEKGETFRDARLLTRSGEQVAISWSGASMRQADGALLGLVGVGRRKR